MKNLLRTINNAHICPDERLSALSRYADTFLKKDFTASQAKEINNHIHTVYSFSPYTPSMAAVCAYNAQLGVAGSVDHDSIAAAKEMASACDILGIGCVTGFELRVSFKHTQFAQKKINNPDSYGIAYMTVQGVPSCAIADVEEFLLPMQKERHERNKKMIANLNVILSKADIPPLEYEKDVLSLSKSNEGGGVTERHLLYACALHLIVQFGKGEKLLEALENILHIPIASKIKTVLSDITNEHYAYDVLGLLKSSFLEKIFIQPNERECIKAQTVTSFAQSINAIPAYAYLGDISDSPTGDKKAEKFEDEFLDELCDELKKMGFLAVTYMPPRNTIEQLQRVQQLCETHGFIEISGVDINSSRQLFNCPQLRESSFTHLINTTWALVAHEKLANTSSAFGICNPQNPMAHISLADRIELYASIGKKITDKSRN